MTGNENKPFYKRMELTVAIIPFKGSFQGSEYFQFLSDFLKHTAVANERQSGIGKARDLERFCTGVSPGSAAMTTLQRTH